MRILYTVVGIIVLAGISLAVSRLKPAPPSVDRATVWIDTVHRGTMLRNVRGLGTLIPVETRLIPAQNDGRIVERKVWPGTKVGADTVILVMSNPQLIQQQLSDEYAVKAAKADYNNLKAQLEAQVMAQRATLAQAQSNLRQSQVELESDEALAKKGLVAQVDLEVARAKTQGQATDAAMEKDRLAAVKNSEQAQLASSATKIQQAQAEYNLKTSQVQALQVRAGLDGILEELPTPIEVGQQVTAGTPVAKVADPAKLKAELKIAETEAKDIALGQPAQIDTHVGIVPGHVTRIDPAVLNGTVTVDCALDGPLPPGARPDLSVEGVVQLERLNDVLYVGRPAFGQANSEITLFRLTDGGRYAVRTKVHIGRTSVNEVEILSGLREGDQVILSDMSAQDAFDRVELK